jgi:hypothetical protein
VLCIVLCAHTKGCRSRCNNEGSIVVDKYRSSHPERIKICNQRKFATLSHTLLAHTNAKQQAAGCTYMYNNCFSAHRRDYVGGKWMCIS